MSTITYLEAIRAAIREEMERDPDVCVLGEDVGAFGGAFQATAGLREQFGAARVLDTPISASAIVGAAVGAALMGLRPVAEMQFMDFITGAFDQVVNMAAPLAWRTAGAMCASLVIRGPSGGGTHSGPWHSRSPEAWFCHVPGLRVVVPATVYDAKGLLKAAIRDDDPVLFLEQKLLYRRLQDDLPDEDYVVPLGRAAVRREGRDLSILTYGAALHGALAAADRLAREEGAEAEVLDLRSLAPLDMEAIAATVRKTNRVLLLHEDTRTGGVGGEIAARIAEDLFDDLDGPIVRVAAPDTPFPYAPALESAYLPTREDVLVAARRLLVGGGVCQLRRSHAARAGARREPSLSGARDSLRAAECYTGHRGPRRRGAQRCQRRSRCRNWAKASPRARWATGSSTRATWSSAMSRWWRSSPTK